MAKDKNTSKYCAIPSHSTATPLNFLCIRENVPSIWNRDHLFYPAICGWTPFWPRSASNSCQI